MIHLVFLNELCCGYCRQLGWEEGGVEGRQALADVREVPVYLVGYVMPGEMANAE